MAVPTHDERDFAFARKYNIPIKVVIAGPDWKGEELTAAYVEDGMMINSKQFDGMNNREGIKAVTEYLETKHWGKGTISYRMRDWLISRQRYWGAPIPMIHCPKCGIVAVPEKDLAGFIAGGAEFRPTGESPLKYKRKIRQYLPVRSAAARPNARPITIGRLPLFLLVISCATAVLMIAKHHSTRKKE